MSEALFKQESLSAVAAFEGELRYVALTTGWRRLFSLPLATHGRTHADLPGARSLPLAELLDAIVRDGVGSATVDDLELLAVPRFDSEGHSNGMFVFAQEPSGLQRRVVEQEVFIRAFFDKSPIGLNLCRLDGLWLESNQAFLDIIGYTATEADGGLTYWQLTPTRYLQEEERQLKSLRETGRYGPYEKEFIRKDGTLVPVRLNGFLIERGDAKFIWSLIEDISARRDLEKKLEHERLKSIQASKLATLGELAASLAHEINNPLSIAESYAWVLPDAVKSLVETGDTSVVNESVAAIQDAIARAGKIVQGLRRLARARDDVSDFRVADAVSQAVTLCAARLRSHGVELRQSIATEACIHGTALQLEQVFINLFNNAFDAVTLVGGSDPTERKHGGWICVTAQSIDEGRRVEVVVEDSGPGVGPEHVDRLFEPFFTTKPVGVGTGLGLGISRGIVEEMGGTLEHQPGPAGARFIIRVPTAPPSRL